MASLMLMTIVAVVAIVLAVYRNDDAFRGAGDASAAPTDAANANQDVNPGAGAAAPNPDPPKQADPPAKPNRPPKNAKAMVNQWLRENLDDGKWEEVKWWESISLSVFHARSTKTLSDSLESAKKKLETIEATIAGIEASGVKLSAQAMPPNDPKAKEKSDLKAAYKLLPGAKLAFERAEEIVKRYESRSPRTICGIRFRSKNKFGANELRDILFDVTGDAAEMVDVQSEKAWFDGTAFGWQFLNDPESQKTFTPKNKLGDLLGNTVKELERGSELRKAKPKRPIEPRP